MISAILTLIKQEISGIIGAGLLLRKAWKIYEKMHNELFSLYCAKDPNAEKEYGTRPEDRVVIEFDNTTDTKNGDEDDGDDLSFKSFDKNSNDEPNEISLNTVKRLLGSVSFGYGLFQIALSFVPPRIMKLIKFLGFESDRSVKKENKGRPMKTNFIFFFRKVALAALRFSSQSTDMKAPLANLTLLWYHCVIQPFFAIDMSKPLGQNSSIQSIENGNFSSALDMTEAKGILSRNLNKYDRSTLFIYFQGRLERTEVLNFDEFYRCHRMFLLFPERFNKSFTNVSQWNHIIQQSSIIDKDQRIRTNSCL